MKCSAIICSLGAGLLLAVCACSSDLTSAGANLQLTAIDTAQAAALSAADATAEDVNVMTASDSSMNGVTVMYDLLAAPGAVFTTTTTTTDSTRYAFWSFSQSCTYNSTTGWFGCPDITKNGLTLSRSAQFLDASGAAMPHYNDTTTASANFKVSVTGVHLATEGADTISRQRTMAVTGLLGHETSRTWNGVGVRSDGGYRQDLTYTRSYHTQDNVTFANILVNLPRTQYPWPISGTVTRQINGTGTIVSATATRTFTVAKTVTITFNGTHLVPMMVGTVSFTLDLYTGKAVKN